MVESFFGRTFYGLPRCLFSVRLRIPCRMGSKPTLGLTKFGALPDTSFRQRWGRLSKKRTTLCYEGPVRALPSLCRAFFMPAPGAKCTSRGQTHLGGSSDLSPICRAVLLAYFCEASALPKLLLEKGINRSLARSFATVFLRADFCKFGEYDHVGRALRSLVQKRTLVR